MKPYAECTKEAMRLMFPSWDDFPTDRKNDEIYSFQHCVQAAVETGLVDWVEDDSDG